MNAKRKLYEVTVKKTVVLSQTYTLEAESRADATEAALDGASEHNAATFDSDWKLVRVKTLPRVA